MKLAGMLAGIFMALPGGMLGRRFGAKRLVLAGLLLMAAGGAPMGAGCNFLLVANGRPLSGVGVSCRGWPAWRVI